MNYAPELWHDFAVTVGGLAGALTGLLFVALSIKGEALAASVSLRSRAAQTLVLFLTSAITAVVLVAPQPRTGTAVELLALAYPVDSGNPGVPNPPDKPNPPAY